MTPSAAVSESEDWEFISKGTMMGRKGIHFLKTKSKAEAERIWHEALRLGPMGGEEVPLEHAQGRVLDGDQLRVVICMVYCQHCGTQNDEASGYCTQCGAALQAPERPREVRTEVRRHGEPRDDECFGLPNGDAICGAIFGGIIIIAETSMMIQPRS